MLHLVKDGHLIAMQSIKEAATLENVIHRLTKGDFKSALLSTIELKVLRDEYAAYSKLVTKSRRSEAKAALVLLKLTAGLSLKKSFTLSDSTPFTLAEFYKLVDAEANKL